MRPFTFLIYLITSSLSIAAAKPELVTNFSGKVKHSDVAKQSQLIGKKLYLSDSRGNIEGAADILEDATFLFRKVRAGSYIAYVKDGPEVIAASEEFAVARDKLPKEIILKDPLEVNFDEKKVVLGETVTLKWRSPYAYHVGIDPVQLSLKKDGELVLFPLRNNVELTLRAFGPYGDVARTIATGVRSIPHESGVDTRAKTRYAIASWLSQPHDILVKPGGILLVPPNLDQNQQLWLNFGVFDLGEEFENGNQSALKRLPGYEKTADVAPFFDQDKKHSVKVRYWSRDIFQEDATRTIELSDALQNKPTYFEIEPRFSGPINIFTAVRSAGDSERTVYGHLRLFSDVVQQLTSRPIKERSALNVLTCPSSVTTEMSDGSVYMRASLRLIASTRSDMDCQVSSRTTDAATHPSERVFLRWLCTECEPHSGETFVDISTQTGFGEVSLNVLVSEKARRPNVRLFLADPDRAFLGQTDAFELPTVTSRQRGAFVNFLLTLLSLGNKQPGPIATLSFRGDTVDTISFDRRTPAKNSNVLPDRREKFRYPSGSPATGVSITILPVKSDDQFRLVWVSSYVPDGGTATLQKVTPVELAQTLERFRDDLKRISQEAGFYEWELQTSQQHRELVYQYAQMGNRLWNATIGRAQPLQDLLTAMKQAREAEDKQKPLLVVVIGTSEAIENSFEFILPFQLLYDDTKFLHDHPKLETIRTEEEWQQLLRGFWGFKYVVMYPIERKPYALSLSKLGVRTAWDERDETLGNCIRGQEAVFGDFQALHSEMVQFDTQSLTDEERLRRWLKESPESSDLVYYYGHSYADSRNPHLSGLRLDPTLNGRGISVSELADDSDIKQFSEGQPILFLNSCSGAQLAALPKQGTFNNMINTSFLDYLSRRGFIGLLAPEQPVESRFAARFASEFLERWLHSGRSMDEVLYSMRRQALEDPLGNPFILLYSYFGNGEVRLDQSLTDAAKDIPHWHHMVSKECFEDLGQKSKD